MSDDLITEDWLRSVGFKWHQLERQENKVWLLWLGSAFADGWTSFEDLGIEVSQNLVGRDQVPKDWFCWLRGDYSGRYSRFIHVRHITKQAEVIALVAALTGLDWRPENHICGCVCTQKDADRRRLEDQRRDLRWLRTGYPWREIEKDDSRGRALPEHTQGAIDGGKAK